MSPRPSTLLGLVLCLGQMIHMQEGALPKPSLRAQPGPVIPRGRPVIFVCQGPAGAELFRLEKGGSQVGSDHNSAPQDGSQGTEARFHIPAVSEDSAGRYRCLYVHVYGYSERSEPVQLQVTEEDVSTPPSGDTRNESQDSGSSGLSREHLYILVGTSVAFLLCLLLLVLLLVHRQHQRKHKSLQSKGEEQRPQERLSPAADITGSRPEPCCGRRPGGDIRPAGPAGPHPQSSPRCVPTARGALSCCQHIRRTPQTLTWDTWPLHPQTHVTLFFFLSNLNSLLLKVLHKSPFPPLTSPGPPPPTQVPLAKA